MLALFFSVGVILYLTLWVVQYLRSGYTDYVHVFLFHRSETHAKQRCTASTYGHDEFAEGRMLFCKLRGGRLPFSGRDLRERR